MVEVAGATMVEVAGGELGENMQHEERSEGEEQDTNEYEIVRATGRFELETRLSRGFEPGERDQRKALLKTLDDVSRLATTARNAGMRENWRRDSAALDAYQAEHGTMPRKNADWATKSYSYPLMRRVSPRLSSNVTATLQRDIDRKWAQSRFDVLIRQVSTCPHYRVGQPVPIPAAAVKFAELDGRVRVTASIYSGSQEGDATSRRLVSILTPRDEYQKKVLKMLVSGEWKAGQIAIEQDRQRADRWYLRIAYKRRVPKKADGVACAINRGIKFFLVGVTSGGEKWIYDGADIVSFLAQTQRRRRSYQNQVKASARVGHGRTRVLQPIEHLSGKAERWRATRCQVIARRFALWCEARGVSRVYVEDFSGIRNGEPDRIGPVTWQRVQEWPYYQLEMRIKACLQELGIETIPVNAEWISQTCPSCGHVAVMNMDVSKWKFRCGKCKTTRHLDVAAAENVLGRGEEAENVLGRGEDQRKKRPS